MAFGLLMQDNTPVDYPFRRSGPGMETSVRLGYVPGGPYYPRGRGPMGFVPGGPYFPQRQFRGYGIPPRQAARVPQYGHMQMPGGPPMGFVPGGPYYPMRARGYGWVSAEGGGDPGTESDTSPVPGTAPVAENSTSSGIVAGLLNLGTSLTNTIAGSIQPRSGQAGTYCPSGYYLSNGRCVPAGGGGSNMGLVLGIAGIGAAFLLLRKRG